MALTLDGEFWTQFASVGRDTNGTQRMTYGR